MTTTSTLAIADERVAQAKQTLQVIQAWPHWNEIALCAQKEYTLSPEQFRLRLPEYQRFMALCAVYPGIGMISEQIDLLWHSHILHTALYDGFCELVIGRKIHHLPCSSYALYGVAPANATDDCTTCQLPAIPSTCYGKRSDEMMPDLRQSILEGGQRFFAAYRLVFGEPDPTLWARTARRPIAEGMAI